MELLGSAVRGEGELWFLSGVWLREKEMAWGRSAERGKWRLVHGRDGEAALFGLREKEKKS
jgi:hypothetical protein